MARATQGGGVAGDPKAFRVFGRVVVLESGQPLPDLMVSVFDHDPKRAELLTHFPARDRALTHLASEENPFGDVLGTALTGEDGRFELRFGVEDFQDEAREGERPDLLVGVFAPLTAERGGLVPARPPFDRVLHFSKFAWMGAGREEGFIIRVRREQLVEHEIALGDEPLPPPAEARSLKELLTEAVSRRDERHEAIREAAAETIAPKAVAALERRDQRVLLAGVALVILMAVAFCRAWRT